MVEDLLRHGGSAGAPARKRSWRCLTEEVLAAYVDRNLNEGETARVETHLADCWFCREQAAFLATAPEAAVQAEVSPHLLARAEALVGGQRAAMSPGLRWAASFAAAAVLLLVTFQLRDRPLELVFPPPAPPSLEQPPAGGSANPQAPAVDRGERQVRNSAPALTIPEIVRPAMGAAPMSDLRFEWKAVSGSLFYEVRVTTAAGDPVWQSERISATLVQPPPSIPLLPGDKYFVWVVAHLPEGKTVRSRAVAFTVLN